MAGLHMILRNIIIPPFRRSSMVAAAVNVCPYYLSNHFQSNTKMIPRSTSNRRSLRLFAATVATSSEKKKKKRRYNGKKKPWQQKLPYESKLERQKRMRNLHVSFVTTHIRHILYQSTSRYASYLTF